MAPPSAPSSLAFDFANQSALLDDVSLTEAAAPNNPTAFRNAVVQTLRDLHPGVLRYMDNGASFGSSLDNLLAPQFARRRAGSSTQQTLQEDIPIGLPDFLTLCQAIGADPWILSLPPEASPPNRSPHPHRLPPRSPPGRASSTPSISSSATSSGTPAASPAQPSTTPKPTPSAPPQIFAAARSSPAFKPASFDLILGSWATVPWYTRPSWPPPQDKTPSP